MTVVRTQNFEGIAAGDPITTGNTGTGGNNVFTGVDGAPVASAIAMHGSVAADVSGTGVPALLKWDTITSTLTFGYRYYLRRTSTPSATAQIMTVRNSTNYINGNNLSTANKILVTHWGGGPKYTSTTTLAQDTWYRVEGYGTVQTASTGLLTWKLFLGDSTTALETYSGTDLDMQTTGAVMFRVGKHATSGNLGLLVDDLAFGNTATAIGPAADPADTRTPASVVSNPGSWSIVGGAPSIVESLADADNVTGIRSPDDPANAAITVEFGPLTPNKAVRMLAHHNAPAGDGTIERTYTLKQGATTKAARTVTLPESVTAYSFTTTTAETATISDWSALRVTISDNKVP